MLYFDTSFLVPLILEEGMSKRVETFFTRLSARRLCVSHWTCVEFSSLIAREVRMKGLNESDAVMALNRFDELIDDSFHVLAPTVADFTLARNYLHYFASKLRGGDALHLAIAHRHGVERLHTLDEGLLRAARLLKVPAGKLSRIAPE